MKIGDQSVYPAHTVYQDCGLDGNSGPHLTETIQHGMTLRQHYAGLALQGLSHATAPDGTWFHDPKTVAAAAVEYADALLAELEKQNEA